MIDKVVLRAFKNSFRHTCSCGTYAHRHTVHENRETINMPSTCPDMKSHSFVYLQYFCCVLFNLCPHIALSYCVCVFLCTVTVQTPLDILFVSGPPLSQPKQVVPHEADCGVERINATMCACKCIHVPVCAHECLRVCTSMRGYVYITK